MNAQNFLNSMIAGVNADVLGSVVWFDLSSGTERHILESAVSAIPSQETQKELKKNLPSRPTAETSFSWAVKQACVGNTNFKSEVISKEKTHHLANIMQRIEGKDAQGQIEKAEYQQVSRIALVLVDDKGAKLATPYIHAENPEHPIAQAICEKFNAHQQALTPNDIRPFVLGVLGGCYMIPLRKAGGMYFVPSEKQEIVTALSSVLESVNSVLYTLPIFKDAGSISTVSTSVEESATDDITALLSELQEFETLLADGEKVKNRTLENRLEKLGDLQSKVALYSRILQKDLVSLEEKILSCEDKIGALLSGAFTQKKAA